MSDVPVRAERWRYAELELRHARGHERPARIHWSPPDRAERVTVAMPTDPDPLSKLVAQLGGTVPDETGEAREVDLLNALGERGWRLVSSRQSDAGSGERRTLTFLRPA